MNEESINKGASERAEALAQFRQFAREGAEDPAHPEVVNKVRELWYRNLDTISGEPGGEKNKVALGDTATMINQDITYTSLGFAEMTPDEVKNILSDYFGVTSE